MHVLYKLLHLVVRQRTSTLNPVNPISRVFLQQDSQFVSVFYELHTPKKKQILSVSKSRLGAYSCRRQLLM